MLLCPLSSEIFLSKANRASGNFALPALFKAIGFAGGGSRERLRSGSCGREGLRALCAFVFAQKLTDQIVRENHKFGRSGVDLKSPRRMGTKRRSLFAIVFCVLFPLGANAQPGPHPPCERASPFPDFAPPGQVPNYRVWIKNQWVLPACTGWTARTGMLVAIAGQFRYTGTADDLLLEVGAISTLKGIRYWSVTENSWRTLITSAAALEGPDLHRQRADFRLSEMKSGARLYFTETENRLGEPVIYGMRASHAGGNLVITMENVSPVKKFMLTLIKPGELQSIHYLSEVRPGIWRYYGLARTGEPPLTAFGVGRTESYINRALALYSHLTGAAVEPVESYNPN